LPIIVGKTAPQGALHFFLKLIFLVSKQVFIGFQSVFQTDHQEDLMR